MNHERVAGFIVEGIIFSVFLVGAYPGGCGWWGVVETTAGDTSRILEPASGTALAACTAGPRLKANRQSRGKR